MASKTFTPSNAINMSNEKDWAANLGMLDWDSTRIVFTKRKLLEFLKYVDVTVDPNFSSISKLPRYAQFINMVDNEDVAGVEADSTSHLAEGVTGSVKPSRRVRTAPGGATSDIFGLEGTDDDALSQAPSLQQTSSKEQADAGAVQVEASTSQALPTTNEEQAIRPSRRVRTAPGGKDSLSEMWGNADNGNEEAFKPSRRVRQIPGGQDNLAGIL